jgi:transglutaminase-like putative cysteine protease
LKPTVITDSDHPLIATLVKKTVSDSNGPVEKAVKLYYVCGDGIRYDPYYPSYLPGEVRRGEMIRTYVFGPRL